MRLRQRRSPLLLLLIPSLALASTVSDARDAQADTDISAAAAFQESTNAGSTTGKKYDVGTKDAPVDGRDGRPHQGPFVEIENLRKGEAGEKGDATDSKKDLPPLKDRPNDVTMVDGKKIPESNDGVMFDKDRPKPKDGTTGTSGGVSEKDKTRKAQEGKTGEKVENKPDPPKEAPPLPHSEEEKISGSDKDKPKTKGKTDAKTPEEVAGLDKPADLPDKTHDKSIPLPGSAAKDHLDVTKGTKPPKTPIDDDDEGIIRPFHSFVLSLTMILVSEVGDKTFLVAALMAMKHDRLVVFTAAFTALIAMTVLSAVLGHAVPTLIPKRITNFLAAGLFLIFGARLLREGMAMSRDEGVSAEMQEVEMELEEKEHLARKQGRRKSNVTPYELEMGLGSRKSRSKSRFPTPPRSPSNSPGRSPSPSASTIAGFLAGLNNLLSLLLSPAWVQTFVMTFLGEWGDRSQIATIAMAAGQDYWWVTLGAILGHGCCTGVAVLGGRAIAGKVSLKVVTIGGAIAFLVFGIIYFVEALYQ
ncbi:hypothetical protein GE09DRAFT_1148540 [Coniochaeta sp. 2T2.1]|nr:hypothetical protein GE09DRAFT_1148540 [Coniochaeta sp. 2T2.1]